MSYTCMSVFAESATREYLSELGGEGPLPYLSRGISGPSREILTVAVCHFVSQILYDSK